MVVDAGGTDCGAGYTYHQSGMPVIRMGRCPMADERPDVAGLVERAFLMGLGVLELTRERTKTLTDDLVERGQMSQSEAKKVADRFSEMAAEQQESVRKTVDAETDRFLKASGVATREDVDALKAEIAELKAMIASKAAPSEDEEYTP
jgi:polyhydroxyalkanoate synthesis regulator phasin